jgi:hypothetical protein
MAKPNVPSWLYIFFAGRGWKNLVKRNGAQERPYNRPYEAK